jgi:hypothetical protein
MAALHSIFSIFSHKLEPFLLDTLKEYFLLLSNPYQQIRESMGKLLSEALQAQWYVGASDLEYLLHDKDALVPTMNSQLTVLQTIAHQLATTRVVATTDSISKKHYLDSCKTLLFWFIYSLADYRVVNLLYLSPFLKELFMMSELADQELQALCKKVTEELYPRFPRPPQMVQSSLVSITDFVGEGISWHIRLHTLPALQASIFF